MFKHVSDGHVGFRIGRSMGSFAEVDAVIKADLDSTHIRLSARPVLASRLARRRANATFGLVESALRAAEHEGGPAPA